MSPRLEQVLFYLLRGDGEKEIAYSLTLSVHTVHCHVRTIYKAFDVHARSELMALFLQRTAAERDALLSINTGPNSSDRALFEQQVGESMGTGHHCLHGRQILFAQWHHHGFGFFDGAALFRAYSRRDPGVSEGSAT